ncbi:hypothetical protein M2263_000937 [Providencia alcalifaciens]|nr:hypothetical protein [Providencia alcalifaciens]
MTEWIGTINGDYPEELPNENSGTHIGFYLTWLINAGLVGEFHLEGSIDELAAVRERKMNGREFLITMCDEKFTDENVNKDGFEFTEFYFQAEEGGFFDDYESVLAQGLSSFYHVENTWENYDKIALVIGEAYLDWKKNQLS